MRDAGLALDDAAWDSPWRVRCVRDKAVLSLGLLVCALALPWWPGGVLTAVVAGAVLLGPTGVGARTLGRALVAPAAFLAVGAASLLVTLAWEGRPVVGLAASATPAAVVAVRGLAATLAVFVLAATTPMVDLIGALRRARVPQACLDVTTVAYRMVFVLLQTARSVRSAQAARLGYDGRRAALRSTAALVGVVLLRAWSRAERLESGLAGRGGGDALRTLDPPALASWRFVLASLAVIGLVAAVSVWVPVPASAAGRAW